MKRIQAILLLTPLTLSAFADNASGLDAISQQTPSVASYTPFVQVVCYAIAGIVCIVGAIWAYYQIQNGRDGKKAVLTTVGSAICFIAMATALPSFFGIDESGNISVGTSVGSSSGLGTGNSGLIADNTGIPQSPINPNIPNLSDMTPKIPGGTIGAQTKTVTEASGYYTTGSYTNIFGNKVTYINFDSNKLASDYYALTGDIPSFDNDYMGDATSIIANAKGDWEKALKNAWNDYLWAVDWYNSGETAPYSPSDYLRVYDTLKGMADAMGAIMSSKYEDGKYSSQVSEAFGRL